MSDSRGGVTTIAPDGSQRLIGRSNLTPNGIALCRGRLVPHRQSRQGRACGAIDAQGEARPYLTEWTASTLPGVNFVGLDMQERIWASVSAQDTGENVPRRRRRRASSS
jgi:hypothetical protein